MAWWISCQQRVKIIHMVVDAGFDSAHNHRLLREDHGIRCTIPPEHGRPPKDPDALPKRQVPSADEDAFQHQGLSPAAQVETVISMLKRNLGSALRARTDHSRCRDLMLRVLTHNIALALSRVFYRASDDPYLHPS